MHRGDDRLAGAEQPDGLGVKLAGRHTILGGLGEVGAGAEVLSLRTQHDRPAFDLVVQSLVGVGDALDQSGVKEVVRGSMDLHHGHVAGEFDGDIRQWSQLFQ